MVRVAILIVSWNKCRYVCRLLDCLKKLELPDIHADIFLVDNCSTDNTANYVAEHYPCLTLLRTECNLGGSGGFSYGLSHISLLDYDYVWLLDDDVTVAPDALRHLVRILEKHPDVGAAGSQIRQLDNPEVINEIGGFFDASKGEVILNYNNASIEIHDELSRLCEYQTVDYCAAASLLVRTEVVRKVGGFKNYFLHFDDVEWCLRIWKEGWKVAAVPKSVIWHMGQQGKTRSWVRYYGTRNALYLMTGIVDTPIPLLKFIGKTVLISLYHTIMGRFFLSRLYIMAVRDFINSVEGKMPADPPYRVISISELLSNIKSDNGRVLLSPSVKKDESTFREVFGDWSFLEKLSADKELFLLNKKKPFHSNVKFSNKKNGSPEKTCQGSPMTTWFRSETLSGTGYMEFTPLDADRIFQFWRVPEGNWTRFSYCFYSFFSKKFDIAVTSLKNPDPVASVIAKKTYYLIENGVIAAKHTPKSLIFNLTIQCSQWIAVLPSLILKVLKRRT